MEIYLWSNFRKKENSTKRPEPSEAVVMNCKLKDDTSFLSPAIEIEYDKPAWNYAYIPDFGRYYFITDITSGARYLWDLFLSCDVLASYKEDIGNFNGYVLRSSNLFNGYIVDEFYPTEADPVKEYQVTNEPFMSGGASHIDTQDGCFVVGLVNNVGSSSAKYGSVFYAVMDKAALAELTQKALTDCVTSGNDFDFTEASQSLQNSIVNPLQYIVSVIWYPLSIDKVALEGTHIGTLRLFDWPLNLSSPNVYALVNNPPVYEQNVTIPLHHHPQASERGMYLNESPYTELILTSAAFGSFNLDSNMLAGDQNIILNYKIDLISGTGILTAYGNKSIAAQVKSQVGVPIQLTQVTRDYIGTATSALGGAASFVGGLFTGNIGGAVMGLSSGIGNAVQSAAAKVLSVGSNGGMSDLDFKTRLDYIFYKVVPEDPDANGRPLCQKRKLSDIPGYIQVSKACIDVACTYTEMTQIMTYMESGFYYE